ncbi:lysophospholipid acyltransferase family protein [Rhodoferax sp.]|uniref:lysophospholipid acyltransferase family protein n=1 Tax=Rhodoferax sp. TaxID=50421 RepID=UPI0025F24892|nr:lysophospholipid acyltransferase family protein [Rhodoferax sp.]
MRIFRVLAKLLYLLWHIAVGWWTIRRHFPQMDDAARGQRVQAWSLQVLRVFGIRLRVQGTPPAQGPLLLVANHISWLDIAVIHAAGYCRFVSKSDVKHWPIVGTLATGAGTLYIERESRRDAMRVVHHMTERLRAGEVVAVFPEGTTGDGRNMLPFHANLLQAAISADVPVLPLALRFVDVHTGALHFAPSFVGDETLLGSLWRTLGASTLGAEVRFGTPERAEGRDRRTWAHDLQRTVEQLRSNHS